MSVFTHGPAGPRGPTSVRMSTHTPAPRRLDAVAEGDETNGRREYPPGAAVMTAAGLEELRVELEELRHRTRAQVEQSLRDARPYGEGSTNDEYHAIREEQVVLEARLAALEDTIARAVVVSVDDAAPDVAVIGSMVTIEDVKSGVRRDYRLGSAHGDLAPDIISAGSPMGQALMGARTGAVVTVDLPNDRSRTVRLTAVKTPPPATGEA
jgi:transcription elongation factor GreA